MQEHCNSIKRPNLQIMGIKEREEMQAKGIGNIIHKIIAENFPNLEKEMPIQVKEVSRTPNRHDQNGTSPWHIIVKTITTETKKRILKAEREKNKTTYKGKPTKIIADFSTGNLKVRRARERYFEHEKKIISNL
jgi:hypothetical protein